MHFAAFLLIYCLARYSSDCNVSFIQTKSHAQLCEETLEHEISFYHTPHACSLWSPKVSKTVGGAYASDPLILRLLLTLKAVKLI